MEDKKRYRHQLYRRFSIYVDDWAKVSMALTHMDVSKYDLTDEDVKNYIVSMRESQEKYKKFKKIRLWWWRTLYIVFCMYSFIILLLILPKIAITILLWLSFITLGLIFYPLYILYEGLEVIFDKKYQNNYFEIDSYIEKMVDDYTWSLQVTQSVT